MASASFLLANASLLPRLHTTALPKSSLPRLALPTSTSSLSCHYCFAISHSLSALSFVSSSHGRRFASIAALAANPFDLDQAAPLDFESPPPDFDQPPMTPQGYKLYVGNLPWSVDSQQVAQVFEDIGSVEMVEVIYDRETGKSRGFAFVTMATEEDANSAIERLDGSEYGGRRLRVNYPDAPRSVYTPSARSGGYDSPFKIFVGNLPWTVDSESLEQIFSEHGKVQEARVVIDRETGRSRGFGFVTLSSENEVNAAITSLDGSDVDGRNIRVNLASERPISRF